VRHSGVVLTFVSEGSTANVKLTHALAEKLDHELRVARAAQYDLELVKANNDATR
jgi:hypothetical protein